MRSFLSFLKSTLLRGLMYVIPLVLVTYLIVKVIGIFRSVVAPIANKIDVSFFGEKMASRILATLLLVLLCFVIGLIAKLKKSSPIKDWIEDTILVNIPGYGFVKGMTEAGAGLESHNLKEVVLVNIEEVWQVGYLMDRIDEDLNAIFIPGAPNPLAGDVVFVNWDRLRKLDVDDISVMKIYRKLGLDSRKVLSGKIDKTIFD